ncbi:MAG: HAD-IA family hydrolase [Synechococcaceae cyanobacterium ELA263]
MVQRLRAVFWDVDGTLAETEMAGHRPAFNRAFAEAALPWHWDHPTYHRLLKVSGGRERIGAFLAEVEGVVPEPARLDRLQACKQVHYRQLVQTGGLAPRPGVIRLMTDLAAAGIPQAIVTTSGRSAVAALLQASFPDLQQAFRFWVCGEDVSRKKPHPEAYRLAIEQAQLDPWQILVLEDSAQGLAAAVTAGLTTLVTLSQVSSTEPLEQFVAARAVLDGLGDSAAPALVRRGPACPDGQVTISYLQDLLREQPDRDG